MNKMIVKLLCISVIASGTIMLSACQKCYDCQGLANEFFLHKGNDSLYLTFQANLIDDSINYYNSKGYQCDTLHLYWYGIGEACGKEGFESVINRGGRCFVKH